MGKDTKRLDVMMVELGLAESRAKAQAMIMERRVTVDGAYVTKAGETVSPEKKIEVAGDACPFVSRGGYKLDKAVKVFGIDLEGLVCADIGASTGGFTDVMLKSGAEKVYAVEVGYGQLDYRLRTDPRVISMERMNARFIDETTFPEQVEFAASDVSFISLKLILPALKKAGIKRVVTLIKPQFEAGREKVGKTGVARDASVHMEVIKDVTGFADSIGYVPLKLDYSPVKGPKGNIEFICMYGLYSSDEKITDDIIEETVKSAHEML